MHTSNQPHTNAEKTKNIPLLNPTGQNHDTPANEFILVSLPNVIMLNLRKCKKSVSSLQTYFHQNPKTQVFNLQISTTSHHPNLQAVVITELLSVTCVYLWNLTLM